MLKKAGFRFLLFFVLTCWWNISLYAQAPITDQQIKQQLAALKAGNNLSAWIYLRLDYVYPDPQNRLPLLLASQQELWRKPATAEEKAAWLLLLANQGYYELQRGDILASIKRYEDAHRYYDANNTIDLDIVEYVYKPLSNNYTRLGDYERAVFVQKSMLKFAAVTHNDELAAATSGNLAISYRSMGNLDLALKQIDEGLKMAKPKSDNAFMLYNVKADILADLLQDDEAATIIRKNIAMQLAAGRHANRYTLFGSYVALGNILARKQDQQAARRMFEQALNLLDKYFAGERQRERANILNQLGRISLEQRKPEQAIHYFNNALSIFGVVGKNGEVDERKLYGDNNVVEALYNRSFAYLQLKAPERALIAAQQALFAADRIRFELASEQTRQRFQQDVKAIAEKAIEIAYLQFRKTGEEAYAQTLLDIAEMSKARTLLDAIRKNQQQAILKNKDTLFVKRKQLERAIVLAERQALNNHKDPAADRQRYELSLIEAAIRKKYPALAAQGPLTSRAFRDSFKALKPGQHVLEYFTGEAAIYAIHINGNKIAGVQQINNAQGIKKQLISYADTYFAHGPDAMLNDPQQFYNASFEIYRQLVPRSLNNVPSYIIIPDGVLGYISFDGLITDRKFTGQQSKWPYLIRKAGITYAFSLQTLLNQPEKATVTQKGASSFTGYFITHEGNKDAFLPAVREERAAINNTVSGRLLSDKEASSKSLLETVSKADVIHLSTHASLFGPQQAPMLGMADRNVFLFELMPGAHAPDLVVLSACQTAGGALQNGEGIISFSRGFAALGTRGTVAGLWNLNDAVAAAIMADFYKNLSQGMTVSSALRKAKLNQLDKPQANAALYLPYYWNALVYMGLDQHIAIRPATNIGVFAGMALGAVFLIGLFVWYIKKKHKK